ncbi:DUF2726 domain-containing protein [Neptuniibacter sp.]|uniref:DUF2726 domain-containing protein n=1 Tax=Neptuniibacter sp. TaxID=1962643 RepID=UPI003B58D484
MTLPILIAAGIAVTLLLALVLYISRRPVVNQVDLSTTLNERMFMPVLEKVVGETYEIISKVPLSEVLQPAENLPKRAQNKAVRTIQGRLFDFIVVDKASRSIICAVELDEHKFDKKTFKKQDLYLEDLCQQIGLPLLRVPSQRGYNLSELIERFERIIEPSIVNAQILSTSKMALVVKQSFTSTSN